MVRRPAQLRLLPLLPAVLALAALSPAAAQWRWRDATGRITVSDLPPPREVADKDILQRPGSALRPSAAGAPTAASAPAAAASAASLPVGDKELQARRKAAEQQAKAKARADEERAAATRADNCNRARAQLSTLESGQRLARLNARGERVFLEEGERADEARRAREIIASECR